jgi:NAD(P)-dependent dehydrogenase (short-subunit alcohol dehydrogenase family)
MKLAGKAVMITGASQGLGREIAKRTVVEGASVLLCARDASLLEKTRNELAALADSNQQVLAMPADVSRQDDVARLFDFAAARFPRLSGLVNNAGIYGPKGRIEENDWIEWTRTIEINLMGTVLPCRHSLPLFRQARYGKIVNLSGGGATAPLPHLSAYAASKAAVVRFTETLAEETRDSGIDVNAIAPGALNTRLLDEILEAGPEKVGANFYERAVKQKQDGGAPLEAGASLCTFLLSEESDGITGRLLSAVWDPWDQLPGWRSELAASDVYTLRRIVPKDRGLNWG